MVWFRFNSILFFGVLWQSDRPTVRSFASSNNSIWDRLMAFQLALTQISQTENKASFSSHLFHGTNTFTIAMDISIVLQRSFFFLLFIRFCFFIRRIFRDFSNRKRARFIFFHFASHHHQHNIQSITLMLLCVKKF